jgi:hypothetical protein
LHLTCFMCQCRGICGLPLMVIRGVYIEKLWYVLRYSWCAHQHSLVQLYCDTVYWYLPSIWSLVLWSSPILSGVLVLCVLNFSVILTQVGGFLEFFHGTSSELFWIREWQLLGSLHGVVTKMVDFLLLLWL